jgi:hypothetical protein
MHVLNQRQILGFFGECVITTIDFENTEQLKPVAVNRILLYSQPTFFSWQAVEPDTGRYTKLAEGLMVDRYDDPLRDLAPYKSNVLPLSKNKFAFEYSYRKGGDVVLYHLVLPQYCYLNEDEIIRMRNQDVTIFTHETRQCITSIHEGYDNDRTLNFHIEFIGPDENKFNEIRQEPQPIIFARQEDKLRGGILSGV